MPKISIAIPAYVKDESDLSYLNKQTGKFGSVILFDLKEYLFYSLMSLTFKLKFDGDKICRTCFYLIFQ